MTPPCGACGGNRVASEPMEYLVVYRDGTTERVADFTAVKQAITLNGKGGTYKLVPKQK